MRQRLWIVIGAVLVWASVLQAKGGVEVITPPLSGTNPTCMVLNVASTPVDVELEIFDSQGMQIAGASSPALNSLHIASVSPGVQALASCRVSSATAKKGDLCVTLCVSEQNTCQAAVTAP